MDRRIDGECKAKYAQAHHHDPFEMTDVEPDEHAKDDGDQSEDSGPVSGSWYLMTQAVIAASHE